MTTEKIMSNLPLKNSLATPDIGPRHSGRGVDAIKWGASLAQIGGYAATGFGLTLWAIPLFLVGVLGWLAVGIAWRDRAIILIHVVAMAAMLTGLVSRG